MNHSFIFIGAAHFSSCFSSCFLILFGKPEGHCMDLWVVTLLKLLWLIGNESVLLLAAVSCTHTLKHTHSHVSSATFISFIQPWSYLNNSESSCLASFPQTSVIAFHASVLLLFIHIQQHTMQFPKLYLEEMVHLAWRFQWITNAMNFGISFKENYLKNRSNVECHW